MRRMTKTGEGMKASDTFKNKIVTSCCSQIVLKQQTNSEINVIGAERYYCMNKNAFRSL